MRTAFILVAAVLVFLAAGAFPDDTVVAVQDVSNSEVLAHKHRKLPDEGALAELRACQTDRQCGKGRTCLNGKCTGFAGSGHSTYKCGTGPGGVVRGIPGHFDKNPAESYRLEVRADDQPCGASERAAVATAACLPRDEKSCDVTIERSDLLGSYNLCGCPNVDIGGDGIPCNQAIDFLAPVGSLKAHGFAPTSLSAPPQHVCKAYEMCFLWGIKGMGINPDYKVTLIIHPDPMRGPQPRCGDSDTPGLLIIPSTDSVEMAMPTPSPPPKRQEGFLIGPELNRANQSTAALSSSPQPSASSPHVLSFPCLASASSDEINCGVNLGVMGGDAIDATICGCAGVNNCDEAKDFTTNLGRLTVKAASTVPLHADAVHPLVSSAGVVSPRRLQTTGGGECTVDGECFEGYGVCRDGQCTGFEPGIDRTKVCVDGYFCQMDVTDLPGAGVDDTFKLATVDFLSDCGSEILTASESIFTKNTFTCDADEPDGCQVNLGVPFRRNTTIRGQDGVRLCGCPGIARGDSNRKCDGPEDFTVPLGIVVTQECTTNKHCTDNVLAYCLYDPQTGLNPYCGGFVETAVEAGAETYFCLIQDACSLPALASSAIGEAFKVLPLAIEQQCGAEVALDPDAIDDEALPCAFDVDTDENCKINIGTDAIPGATNRLCGCAGQDNGGDGIPCNQPEDFDADLGILSVAECIMSNECEENEFCIEGTCQADSSPPFVEEYKPAKGSNAVPPVKEIKFFFSESVTKAKADARIILINTAVEGAQWEVRMSSTSVTVSGLELTFVPEPNAASLPEGDYLVGFDAGIVADLQGNWNQGKVDYDFSIRKDGGCPYIYITGFYHLRGNPNGLYRPIEPERGHPVWKGGDIAEFFLYWTPERGETAAAWIIDNDLDPDQVLAGTSPELMASAANPDLPMSGLWYKFVDKWEDQPDVHVLCSKAPDRTGPVLIGMSPEIASYDVPIDSEVVLTFNEPVTYGHSRPDQPAEIVFAGDLWGGKQTIVPDSDEGMRGKWIVSDQTAKIVLKPGEPFTYGEVYYIDVSLGAITDLAYNPWVQKETLVFQAYGVPCLEYGNLGPQYVISGREYGEWPAVKHLTEREVACAPNFSVDGPNQTEIVVCDNENFTPKTIECKADCGPFQQLGPQFALEGTGVEHGAVVNVTCAEGFGVSAGADFEEVECNDGKWGGFDLRCGPSCGPFPSLGIAYSIEGDGTTEGTQRVLRCREDSVLTAGAQPQASQCRGSPLRWTEYNIECKGPCGEFPSLGSKISARGLGRKHGTVYTVDCARGYASRNYDSTTAICTDGIWTTSDGLTQAQVLQQQLNCEPSCGDYNPGGNGYDIRGSQKWTGDSITVSCLPNATREAGTDGEIVTCRESGAWTLKQLICRAPCNVPTDQFGRSYDYRSYLTSFGQGAIASIQCAPGAAAYTGVEPSAVVCNDGVWLQGETVPLGCFRRCSEFMAPLQYDVLGSGTTHLSTREVRCADGYDPMDKVKQLIQCYDGEWDGQANLTCRARCNEDQLLQYKGAYIISPPGSSDFRYMAERTLKCKPTALQICGPGESTITCTNGRFDKPATICTFPSCTDGLQNGDEEGVDCGGSCEASCPTCSDGVQNGGEDGVDCGIVCRVMCEPTCTDGIRNGGETSVDCGGPCPASSCPSCTDGIKNGDEQDIDCGGSCPACQSCIGLPILSAAYEVISDTTTVPHGRKIDVKCREGAYQVTENAKSAVELCQTAPIECRNGIYDSSGLRLTCILPTCTDGYADGDEVGVDCGGSCPNACISCNDGIQNGVEQGIDCGGPECRPCRICSEGDFKLIDRDLYQINVTFGSVNGYSHGDVRMVDCLSNARRAYGPPFDQPAQVTCLDGQFEPPVRSVIRCERDPLAPPEGGPSFAAPAVVKPPAECTNRVDAEGCCAFLPEFFNVLLGECGTWLYGETQEDIRTFCEGSGGTPCVRQMEAVVESFAGSSGPGCEDVTIARSLIDDWCARPSGQYCFAQAGSDKRNFAIDRFALKQSQQLDVDCQPNSCFRSNLDYYESLHRLAMRQPGGRPDTRMLSIDAPLEGADFRGDLHTQGGVARRVARDMTAARSISGGGRSLDGLVDRLVHPVLDFAAVGAETRRRLMAKVDDYLGGFTAQTVDIMCLKEDPETGSAYCASAVQQIATYNPVVAAPREGGVPVDPCKGQCITIVARTLGQIVSGRGEERQDPYDTAMGALLISYGRFFCQQNRNRRYCGEYIFQYRRRRNSIEYSPVASSSYPNCECPVGYIGDGECDVSCFNEACGWDGDDCFFRSMFPNVDDRLTHISKLETLAASLGSNPSIEELFTEGPSVGAHTALCSPFHPSFNCSRTEATFDCKKAIDVELDDKGCCLSPLWEVLREALRIDAVHPRLTMPEWRLDRSLAWVEQKCGISLDRACAQGLPRQVVRAGFELDNINFDRLTPGWNSTLTERDSGARELQAILKATLADLLGVLPSDVTEVRMWPGSVRLEVAVDVGGQARRAKTQLKALHESSELRKAIEAALADKTPFRAALIDGRAPITVDSATIYTSAVQRESPRASSLQAPPMPYVGTLGMEGLENSLIKEDCPVMVPLDIPESASLPYAISGQGTADGSTRTVACQPGYDAIEGTSPQVVTCSNGKWLPPRGEYLLFCRLPCGSDPYTSTSYQTSGFGERHGNSRTVSCIEGFERTGGPDPETLVCDNGVWPAPTLTCQFGGGCLALEPIIAQYGNYSVLGSDTNSRTVRCASGYAPTKGSISSQTFVCTDGAWVPECAPGRTSCPQEKPDITCAVRSVPDAKPPKAQEFPVWAIVIICLVGTGFLVFLMTSPILYQKLVRPYFDEKQRQREEKEARKRLAREGAIPPSSDPSMSGASRSPTMSSSSFTQPTYGPQTQARPLIEGVSLHQTATSQYLPPSVADVSPGGSDVTSMGGLTSVSRMNYPQQTRQPRHGSSDYASDYTDSAPPTEMIRGSYSQQRQQQQQHQYSQRPRGAPEDREVRDPNREAIDRERGRIAGGRRSSGGLQPGGQGRRDRDAAFDDAPSPSV
ncbi:unnamed protein product [Vitrella brassicaformis CCMP3155]|uniref:Sushi domain-containing protein n=5 Tax=Vitrella brassicaformis TaxID=1169539 RepID=A0A0G4E9W8_VITBC|nr:unnamed protein product [Vitrella brassicaformis CCMP3155]|eukprot:CEL92240.1 unnamed protein product [Vitrella brassicaformis CCMP3155]